MNKLLHIIAAPREEESRTLKISRSFLDAFTPAHPDWVVEELDLFNEELPGLAMKRADGRYMLLDGVGLFGKLKEEWEAIIAQIERFKSADGYLVSAPMWNFSIPYVLKQYIDIIVQPKHLFRYTGDGVAEGLINNRKMVFITSRGGQYLTSEARPYDFQEPYIRTIFGFVGITDITFVIAQPMDTPDIDLKNRRLEEAKATAAETAKTF
jgi:FMN-dependent NADH-azoreductase